MKTLKNEIIFIKEDVYQEVKKKMSKKDDYFTKEELTNIYKNSGEIQAN